MKRILLTFFCLIMVGCLNAQHFVSRRWDARFGGVNDDDLYAICKTNDGAYILGGTSLSEISGNKTQPSWGSYDYWIVKIDRSGNYLWDKRFGGIGDDAFMTLSPTNDGGCILGGWTGSGISGDKTQASQGDFDYWLVKVDSLGNKQWDRRFGGSGEEILRVVKQTKDGGYIIGGDSESSISGDKTQNTRGMSDYWIVKIDSAGNKQWDKRFGGSSQDAGNDVIQTPDGGYLIGGTSGSDSSGDKTQPNFTFLARNLWVVKTDSLGNKQWDKVFGCTGNGGETFGNSLNLSNGYLLGSTSGSGIIGGNKTIANCGFWLIKIDTLGNIMQEWAYGTGTNCGQTFGNMVKTTDGGYLLTGTSGDVIGGDKTENNLSPGQAWTIKIDSQMNRVWDKTSLTRYTWGFDGSAGVVEGSTGCYVVGVVTTAGIGGEKTQPNWEPHDTLLDYWVVEYCDSFPLGIQEPEGAMHLQVYPNPTSNELSISIQKDGVKEASYTLTNTAGQAIYQSTADHLASSYTKILDLSGLPSGVYMLEVTVDGERIVKKVLKE